MKKFIVAILAVLYLGTSTGATVNLHYCMGKLSDWSLIHDESKTCGTCGMKKVQHQKKGCCKDEKKFVKIDSDQKFSGKTINTFRLVGFALPLSFEECNHFIIYPDCSYKQSVGHSPPSKNGVDIYIRNCVFLI
jgi:hypothetical protein